MQKNNIQKFLLIILILFFVLSIPCLYAFWGYAVGLSTYTEQNFSITYFPWIGEDITPDDGEEGETTQHEGVRITVEALNTEGSKLNDYIDKRIKNFNKLEYGSVDKKQSASALLSDVADTNFNFNFILEGIIVNEGGQKVVKSYYMYMVDLTEYNRAMNEWDASGIRESTYEKNPENYNIYFNNVYKVTIERDAYGKWKAVETKLGYTGFGYYQGSNNGGGQKVWTFTPKLWKEGTPPV